jgi:2-dehydropantoate 2-reductase
MPAEPEMHSETSPIVIWGAGAIGGTLAAALIEAGESVMLVDNSIAHVDAINARGLVITGPFIDRTIMIKACLPQDLTGRYRRFFLAVKAHHTEPAISEIMPHLEEDGYVVSFQNGLNERVIARLIGAERTVGAFVNFGADIHEPGLINYGGRGAVVVGEMDGIARPRTEELHRLLLSFDSAAILTPNISGYLWAKMIYGAQLFATALSNESIADVMAMQRFRPVMTRLAREIGAVAAAEGVSLQAFDGFDPAAFLIDASVARTAQSFDDMVVHNRRSAKSHSGIWRDLAIHKRKTEIDAQIAPAIAIGASHGLDLPVTRRLVQLIHLIERGELSQTVGTLALLADADIVLAGAV